MTRAHGHPLIDPCGRLRTTRDAHLRIALRLLDADAKGADWREVARVVLHLIPKMTVKIKKLLLAAGEHTHVDDLVVSMGLKLAIAGWSDSLLGDSKVPRGRRRQRFPSVHSLGI